MSDAATNQVSKILFADQLRGLAALSVVLTHLVAVYWLQKDLVAEMIFSPVQLETPPAWVISLLTSLPLNPGPFGVAIFFLISGFVIPFSFRHHNTLEFLTARLLRIFPTYLAIIVIGLAARWVSSLYWGQPFVVEPVTVLANMLLVHDLGAMASIDLINWTLLIELKFYLLYAFCRPMILHWKGAFVLGLAVTVFALTLAAAELAPLLPARAGMTIQGLATEAMYLPFMLLGTLMYLRHQSRLDLLPWLGATLATLVVFAATWRSGSSAASYTDAGVAYLWSFGVFWLCFMGRRFTRPSRVLGWMSAVSYPFYLVHSLLGYVLLQIMTLGYGLSYALALAVSLAAAVLVAWAVHLAVERPSIILGKRVSWSRATSPPAMPA